MPREARFEALRESVEQRQRRSAQSRARAEATLDKTRAGRARFERNEHTLRARPRRYAA
jgi:hypothetical protein